MKKIYPVLFILVFCVTTLSCKGLSNGKNDMRTKFSWNFYISSPVHYCSQIKYAKVYYGDNNETTDVIDQSTLRGLGNVNATTYSVNPPTGEVSIPKGIDMVWVSIADKKIYRANIKFSQQIQNKLLKAFREGFYSHWRESNMDFNELDVTILPGGHLWLYLGIGNLRRVLICDTLKGEEIHMTLKEFSEDFYNAYQTVDSLCADGYDTPYIIEHGSEYDKIWGIYAQRFNYQFDIQFENKQTELRKGNFIINFANGEILNHDDPGYFEQPSRPNKIEFQWIADDMLYTGHFYFDEEEVKKAFMDVYGNNPTQPGKIIIQVSKYNNWFDIYLEAGNKKYKFEKTKIHVFKQGVNDSDDKAVVIYDNHPQDGNDILNFIGE
ncbi:DUF2931 family protein [Prevotella multiformis]|uniref:DUF2931 family protein n=1 Tax=Prevotella multiformis DSM 16608 TaxID=888743 RepID=F0F4H7_9BACT|nr:DUF2931 family protein [Prevotella multiformis]EGC21135.1 hypothetical protein HMPREF9141_0493 [Prevotella multiformis DSM 16608]